MMAVNSFNKPVRSSQFSVNFTGYVCCFGEVVLSDGSAAHCRACAELLLDDVVLVWADCGHAGEDRAVLFDRPVCVICEAG